MANAIIVNVSRKYHYYQCFRKKRADHAAPKCFKVKTCGVSTLLGGIDSISLPIKTLVLASKGGAGYLADITILYFIVSSFNMSLMSVLIGLLLNALIMAGVMHGFGVAKRAFYRQQQAFLFLDKGRVTLHYLARDIQASGYRGCRTRDLGFPLQHNYSDYHSPYSFFRFDQPLFGFLATRGLCYGKMPDSACHRVKENTHVLILYNIPQKINKVERALVHLNDAIETNRDHGIQKNGLVLLSDCYQGDLFIANRVEATQIYHDQILGVNKTDTVSKRYTQNAEIVELQTVTYYVGAPERHEQNNREGVLTPRFALFRDDFMQPAQEIVPDVSDLQFEFGMIDTETNHYQYKKMLEMKEQDWPLVQNLRIRLTIDNKRRWEYEISLRNRLYTHLSHHFDRYYFLSCNAYDDAKPIQF
jgi:Tfp pilus assembly protein PilW